MASHSSETPGSVRDPGLNNKVKNNRRRHLTFISGPHKKSTHTEKHVHRYTMEGEKEGKGREEKKREEGALRITSGQKDEGLELKNWLWRVLDTVYPRQREVENIAWGDEVRWERRVADGRGKGAHG